MAKFRITETATYEVEAADAKEAEALFLDRMDTVALFIGVTERTVEEVNE